jgi:hypothetical protein
MELDFINSYWVAKEALTVSIQEEKVQVHKSCYESLAKKSE